MLIPQYRTGCATEQNFFRRKNLICLRAKSIEITVTELDLLIRSSKVDRNRCRFVEFHDWIVLVRTSLFHEETNSRFAKLFRAQVEGRDFTNVKVSRSASGAFFKQEMTKHHQQRSWQLLNHCDISYRPKGKLKRVDGWYDLRREMVAVCVAGGLYLRMVACDMVGPSSTGPEY